MTFRLGLRLHLAPKLTLVYVLFALVLLLFVGSLAYLSGRSSLETATVSILLSTATEKEAALNDWINERQSNIAALASSPHVIEALVAFVRATDSSAAQSAHDNLVTELQLYTGKTPGFIGLFIMGSGTGQIIASTDPEEEGAFKEDRPYFINGKNGPYLQNPYFSLSLQRPVMTASIPLRSANGQLLGVLAGHLDLNAMNPIIARRSGQQQTDDAFLVNTENLMVTQPRLLPNLAVLQQGIHTEAVQRCLAPGSGIVFGDDYRGVPAIVVYRWLADRQLCLIVKVDQAEALQPVQSFGLALVGIGGAAVLVASLLGVVLARTLTRPILALQVGVTRLRQGEMGVRLPEGSADELGVLAREFNRMASAIAEKDGLIRSYAQRLEQRVAERTEALRASETRFRYLFAHNPLPMWVCDLETLAFLDVNDAAVANYGYSHEEFLKMRVVDIRPAEDVPRLLAELTGPRPDIRTSGEWRHRLKDGRLIDVDIISHVLDFSGHPSILVVAQDVTARKQAQVALQRSEARFRALIQNSSDSVTVLSENGIVTYESSAIERVLGYKAEELFDQNFVQFVHPDDIAAAMDTLATIISEPGTIRTLEVRGRHKDGRWRTLEATGISLLNDPAVAGIVVNAHDITERKQAEEALRDSERRFRALIEHSSDGILLMDRDRTILYESPASVRILGFAEPRIGQKAPIDVHPDDLPFGTQQVTQVMQHSGVVVTGQLRVRHADGSWRWVERVVTNLLDEPSVGATVVNFRDITDRRQAEDALRESESRFRTAVETVPGGILIIDQAGAIVLVNEQMTTLFGYTRDELTGMSIESLLPERVRQGHVTHRERYFAHPSARLMGVGRDLAGRRKDGTEFPIEIGLNYTVTEHGTLTLAFVTDITQRKQAEAVLTEALSREQATRLEAERVQHRLAFVVEASTLLAESFDYLTRLKQFAQFVVPRIADWCTVHVLEQDGSINQVALAHVDPAKIAWAEELQRRFPPDPNAQSGVYQVVRSGKPEFYPEITDAMLEASIHNAEQLRLAREIGFTSAMTVPFVTNDRVLGAITLVTAESGRHFGPNDLELAIDLAGRAALLIENAYLYEQAKQFNASLEVQVKERTAQLEAANQELEAFSYSVSHDLRAPLRAIDGFSRMLLRDYAAELPADGQRRLQTVRNNAQQMGHLIDDLLTFSRLNRRAVQKQPIVPGDLVRAVLEDLNSERENRQVEITLGDLPSCQADPTLLKQVYVNLLSNALKYTRPRPVAHIEIGYIQGAYFVKDDGVGFDMQYVDKLFGVFQRLHRAEEFEGTGVGLAIVQRIIHRHGGRVWAEAQIEVGATFYFTLEGWT